MRTKTWISHIGTKIGINHIGIKIGINHKGTKIGINHKGTKIGINQIETKAGISDKWTKIGKNQNPAHLIADVDANKAIHVLAIERITTITDGIMQRKSLQFVITNNQNLKYAPVFAETKSKKYFVKKHLIVNFNKLIKQKLITVSKFKRHKSRPEYVMKTVLS